MADSLAKRHRIAEVETRLSLDRMSVNPGERGSLIRSARRVINKAIETSSKNIAEVRSSRAARDRREGRGVDRHAPTSSRLTSMLTLVSLHDKTTADLVTLAKH